LGDEEFGFMKKELTLKDLEDVKEKIEREPQKPNGVGMFRYFPSFAGLRK
jgi:hypothetical protein